MSFIIQARGTREEVVSSLDNLTTTQLGSDSLGMVLRNALVDAISVGVDLEPPSDQRYLVNVIGHSGPGAVVTLTAKVELVSFPYAVEAKNEAAPVTNTDSQKAEEDAAGQDSMMGHHASI